MDARSFFVLVSSVIYLFVAYRIYHLNPNRRLNQFYALACGCSSIIGFIEYELLHSVDLEQATFLYKTYNLYFINRIFILYSVWIYAKMDQRLVNSTWAYVFHFFALVPPIVYILSYFLPDSIVPIKALVDGGWTTDPSKVPVKYFLGISWIALNTGLTACLYFVSYRNATNSLERRINLSLTIFSAFTTTTVLAANTLLHFHPDSTTPIYTVPYTLPFYLFLAWVFSNYRLFDVSPQTATYPILESMSDMVILTNPQHDIIYVNEAGLKMFELEASQVLEKNIDLVFQIPESYQLLKFLPSYEVGGKATKELIVQSNYQEKFLLLSVQTLGRKEVVTGYLYMGTNMSIYKEKEQQIQKYNRDLERSNEDLEQFIYIASHDLKEPLRMVNSFVHLLGEEYKEIITQEGYTYIQKAKLGTQQMTQQLNDLLNYSKIRGKAQHFESLNLHNIIDTFIAEKKLSYVDYDALPSSIWVQPHRIYALFEILLIDILPSFAQKEILCIKVLSKEHITYWDFSIQYIGVMPSIYLTPHQHSLHYLLCQKIVQYHHGTFIHKIKQQQTYFHFTIRKK